MKQLDLPLTTRCCTSESLFSFQSFAAIFLDTYPKGMPLDRRVGFPAGEKVSPSHPSSRTACRVYIVGPISGIVLFESVSGRSQTSLPGPYLTCGRAPFRSETRPRPQSYELDLGFLTGTRQSRPLQIPTEVGRDLQNVGQICARVVGQGAWILELDRTNS